MRKIVSNIYWIAVAIVWFPINFVRAVVEFIAYMRGHYAAFNDEQVNYEGNPFKRRSLREAWADGYTDMLEELSENMQWGGH